MYFFYIHYIKLVGQEEIIITDKKKVDDTYAC